MRELVAEHRIGIEHLVQPLFVVERDEDAGPIESMPGISRLSLDATVAEARELFALGIKSVLLFGIPAYKDAVASSSYDRNGIVQRAIRAVKAELPGMLVMADLCGCEYTDHGHCGILDSDGEVDNDTTLELLCRIALTYADAGADVVAPSDMMDGRVKAIRCALDGHGRTSVAIMAYSAKYASAFYGPFRDAAGSAPRQGDRRGYQMDAPNSREALREIALDIAEGADIVMVKPALAYLDVIAAVRASTLLPVAAYNVSGEYAMVKAAAAAGAFEERAVVLETLTAIRRAGADIIITYHAKDAAKWLAQ